MAASEKDPILEQLEAAKQEALDDQPKLPIRGDAIDWLALLYKCAVNGQLRTVAGSDPNSVPDLTPARIRAFQPYPRSKAPRALGSIAFYEPSGRIAISGVGWMIPITIEATPDMATTLTLGEGQNPEQLKLPLDFDLVRAVARRIEELPPHELAIGRSSDL